MVGKAQIRELREQNISSIEELTGYVSRAPVAIGVYKKAYKIQSRIRLAYARSGCIARIMASSSWCGAAGVHVLATWQDSARYALVVMFVFTATAHFNKMKMT